MRVWHVPLSHAHKCPQAQGLSPSPSQKLSQSLELKDLLCPHPSLVPRARFTVLGSRVVCFCGKVEIKENRDEVGGTKFHVLLHPAHAKY